MGDSVAAGEGGQQTAPALKEATPAPSAPSVEVSAPPASPPPLASPDDTITVTASRTSEAVTSAPVAGDVVTAPIRRRKVDPDYPAAAKIAGKEGQVVLQAVVGVDGKVRDVKVLKSVHKLLDEAALKAVRQYEYTPGKRNGVPEAVTLKIPVSFTLH